MIVMRGLDPRISWPVNGHMGLAILALIWDFNAREWAGSSVVEQLTFNQ